ncbi:MAG TPA: flagellar biosynthetic protein FliO, partial [Telluria sp.]|nr:flagellar biosynthetic protein FliO [Telluria sp.]
MTSRLLLALGLAIPLAACATPPAPQAGATAAPAAATQPATVPAAPAQPVQAAPQPAVTAEAPAAVQSKPAVPERRAAAPAAKPAQPATPQLAAAATEQPAQPEPAPQAAEPAPQAQAQAPVQPAPQPQPQFTSPAAPSTGSLLQSLLALVFVLALLAALAWFVKRFNPRGIGSSANLRMVGSLSLGTRERIVVVEVGDQWIVVGASPGRINALASMPKQEGAEPQPAAAGTMPAGFADWLKQTIDKR